jgi:hypothetical protein
MREISIAFFVALAIASLASCGGGGASAPAAPTPTVSVTVDTETLVAGSRVIVSWSSTNASSCLGSNGWSGSKPVNGSETIVPSTIGSIIFTLSCSNGGNTGSASVTIEVVPELEITVTTLVGSQLEDTSESYSIIVDFNREPLEQPTLEISSELDNGSVSINGLEITYLPSQDYFGNERIEFSVTAEGKVAKGIAEIEVIPVNDLPIVSLSLLGEDANGFTFAEPTVNFRLEVDDVDNPPVEISVAVTVGGVPMDIAIENNNLSVSLPPDFAVGRTYFEVIVSDLQDSVSVERSTWVIKSLEILDSDTSARMSLFWGNQGEDFRAIDYFIFLDGLTAERHEQAIEMLHFYFSTYLSNGKDSLQTLINRTFNVYLVDFLPSLESNLSVETGCFDEDEDIFCIDDVRDAVFLALADFSDAPHPDYISVITGVSGRGVNLGNINIQPLVNNPAENTYFGTANFTLAVLKHEFGHAFMNLGDDYTSDYQREDDEGNKIVDMSERLGLLDAFYANITLQDPDYLIKWDHHLKDTNRTGVLPGRDVQSDLSNLAIGAWPGCYVHDSECHRTTYNNVMNGDYTSPQDASLFYESRHLTDAFLYDPIGEEAFILATIRRYLDDTDTDLFTNQSGDYFACTATKVPPDLFKVDWYLDGEYNDNLNSNVFSTPDDLSCVPISQPETGSAWSTVGIRVNPLDPGLFDELKVEDSFEEFYDVYDGIFSGFVDSGCPLYEWHSELITDRWCRTQSVAYSVAESRFIWDSQMMSREDYIEKYGDIILLYEWSGLGHQIQINWDLL